MWWSAVRRILTSAKTERRGRQPGDFGLVKQAGDRIGILPGGGINAENIERVARRTSAREFHTGLSSTLPYPQTNAAAFERKCESWRKR